MCTLDDIEPNEFLLPQVEVKETPLDYVCDFSIKIKLHAVESPLKYDFSKRLECVCCINSFQYDINVNDNVLFIELLDLKSYFRYNYLVNSLCHRIRIKGDCDSFAIVKFYKGNCLTEGAKPIYEDYVTPEYSMDIAKLESFLKEIVNNK